jgi:hypothetical protein
VRPNADPVGTAMAYDDGSRPRGAKLYREQSEALAKTVEEIERLVRQKFGGRTATSLMSLTAPNRGLTGKQRAALDLQVRDNVLGHDFPAAPAANSRVLQFRNRAEVRRPNAVFCCRLVGRSDSKQRRLGKGPCDEHDPEWKFRRNRSR